MDLYIIGIIHMIIGFLRVFITRPSTNQDLIVACLDLRDALNQDFPPGFPDPRVISFTAQMSENLASGIKTSA